MNEQEHQIHASIRIWKHRWKNLTASEIARALSFEPSGTDNKCEMIAMLADCKAGQCDFLKRTEAELNDVFNLLDEIEKIHSRAQSLINVAIMKASK